jgi:hypothetical protein
MKTWGKKCVMVLLALVIALGSVTAISGCKAKKSTAPAAPAKKAVEPAKQEAAKTAEQAKQEAAKTAEQAKQEAAKAAEQTK